MKKTKTLGKSLFLFNTSQQYNYETLILGCRYFAFELCAANLQDWAAAKFNGAVPDQLIGLHQLASGLAFVHDKQHVHRDICPRNILISALGDRLIISDFGLCKRGHDNGSNSVSNRRGHEKWLSPERIVKRYDPNYRMTIDSDTWAMGCTFYFFITKGSHPFDDKDLFEMLKKVNEGNSNLEGKFLLHSRRSSNPLIQLNRFVCRKTW